MTFAALKAQHDAQRNQLAEANARNALLVAEIGRLAALVAQSNDRITELLALVLRKKGGPAPPPKAPPPPPALAEDQKAAYDARPKAPPLPEKPEKEKKPMRPTGRRPLPDHLLAEEHTLKPEPCPECGGSDLQAAGEVVETKPHVVQEHQRKRVVVRKTCTCRHCGTRTTARSLPAPFERSKATCEWLAWAPEARVPPVGGRAEGAKPPPEILHAHPARPHPARPRPERHPSVDGLSGQPD